MLVTSCEPNPRPPFKKRLVASFALLSFALPLAGLVEIGARVMTGVWHLFTVLPPHGLVIVGALLAFTDAAVGLFSRKRRVRSLLPPPDAEIDVLRETASHTMIWLAAFGFVEALVYWAEDRLFLLAALSPWIVLGGAFGFALYGAQWKKAMVALQRASLRRRQGLQSASPISR